MLSFVIINWPHRDVMIVVHISEANGRQVVHVNRLEHEAFKRVMCSHHKDLHSYPGEMSV